MPLHLRGIHTSKRGVHGAFAGVTGSVGGQMGSAAAWDQSQIILGEKTLKIAADEYSRRLKTWKL